MRGAITLQTLAGGLNNKTKGFYAHKRADLLKQFKTNSFETNGEKPTIEKEKKKKKRHLAIDS